jgi:SAM-dependent methyltransferase
MTDHQEYYTYLRGRSLTGRLYRNLWLYPRLAGHLSGRVLDVGCGIGDMLRFRPETIGVDINPQTVAWCRHQGLAAHQMEPDKLPFAAGTFDGLILDNVLEHIAEPRPLLGEARRVLKPAGRVLAGVPGEKGYRSDPDHKIFYDEAGLVRLMEDNGFLCRTLLRMPLPLPGLSAWMRQYCLYGVFEVHHG